MVESKKKKIQYDAAYISYVKNGDSAAVFITRDTAKEVPTDDMWVDVISTNKKDRKDGRWDFNYFTVELFPRKTRPEYPPDASKELKKYITWQTACKDIENHRKQGHRGSKYRICPQLVNINKDEYTMEEAVEFFIRKLGSGKLVRLRL